MRHHGGTGRRIVSVPSSYLSADAPNNSVAVSRKGEIWVIGHNPHAESLAQFHPADDTWQRVQGANSGTTYGHVYIRIVDPVWCVG